MTTTRDQLHPVVKFLHETARVRCFDVEDQAQSALKPEDRASSPDGATPVAAAAAAAAPQRPSELLTDKERRSLEEDSEAAAHAMKEALAQLQARQDQRHDSSPVSVADEPGGDEDEICSSDEDAFCGALGQVPIFGKKQGRTRNILAAASALSRVDSKGGEANAPMGVSTEQAEASRKLLEEVSELEGQRNLAQEAGDEEDGDEIAAELRKHGSVWKQGLEDDRAHYAPPTPLPFFKKQHERRTILQQLSLHREGDYDDADACNVYVGFDKMSSIIKGLLRQDRRSLLAYFTTKYDLGGLQDVSTLHVHGTLRRSLIPYLWPGRECHYWQMASNEAAAAASDEASEAAFWGSGILPVITNEEEERAALRFLMDFKLLASRQKYNDYLIWDLTAPHMQEIVDERATLAETCPLWMSLAAPQFPHAFVTGLASRLLQLHDDGEISSHAAQLFKQGTKVQLVSSTSPLRATITIRTSHGSGMQLARAAVRRHLRLFPGLVAQLELREMPELDRSKYHEPVSILLASSTLYDRYEGHLQARSRERVAAALANKAGILAVLRKAEMEHLRHEELRQDDSTKHIVEERKRFLGFEVRKRHAPPPHVHAHGDIIAIHDSVALVANEYCRLGQLAYYEIEILEMGKGGFLACGFVSKDFEPGSGGNQLGHCRHSWCVDSGGNRSHASVTLAFGKPWRVGSVIGIACDLQVGLLHISVNGVFSPPASALALMPPGLYPAFSAKGPVKVKYKLKLPFRYPPPSISVEEEDHDTEVHKPTYCSIWECRMKAAEVSGESDQAKELRANANRKRVAIDVLQAIERLVPRHEQCTIEVTFPDARFKASARIIVVIVDSEIALTREDFHHAIYTTMGPIAGWNRHKYREKFQSYVDRLMPVRELLVTAKQANPDTIILPILMPGWDAHQDMTWWPEGIADLKSHPLAIELLPDEDSWLDALQDELLPKLSKHLADWRGVESSIPRAIVCPSCLASGSAAPHCFDSDECRKQLKLARPGNVLSHLGEQRCPDCTRARREPSFLQLVKPLVYVSCCMQSVDHAASKRLVEAVYDSIETFFETVCFPPVASHSRKPHLPQTDLELLPELQCRMLQSCCVLVCLSDSYPMSSSQLRILRQAILARKSIIPVLLPAVGEHRAGAEQAAYSSPAVSARASAKWRRRPALNRLYEAGAADFATSLYGGQKVDGDALEEEFFRRLVPVLFENPLPDIEEASLDPLTLAGILARVIESMHT